MVNATKRILVFDSGIGGLSVFDAIAASGRALEIDYVADNAWLPYGLKSDADLRARVPSLLASLTAQWLPELVVLACNTASTIALDHVRAALGIPVVGVVPPVKPAATLTKSGVIGLLATPATVKRSYTDALISEFAADKKVVRYGSAALVEAAEAKLRGEQPDPAAVSEAIEGLFGAGGDANVDVIALACTHFPLLVPELAAAAPRACMWMDSGAAIARRVADVLSAAPGHARGRRAGFTDIAAARSVFAAFELRGFASFAEIGPPPAFDAAPLLDTASA